MLERRRHERLASPSCKSLRHPLLGTLKGEIRNLSPGGICLATNAMTGCYVMMKLDACIHGPGEQYAEMMRPVRIVRIRGQEIALQFLRRPKHAERPLPNNPKTIAMTDRSPE